MFAFEARQGAHVSCHTDFSSHLVANLHFYDADYSTVPFHVSLRPSEGVVVVNRRDAKGWRREIALKHRFTLPRGKLEVAFGSQDVQVIVDGDVVGRFDRFPRLDVAGRFFLRRGFPDLAQIAHVVSEGAVLAETVIWRQGAKGARSASKALLGEGAFFLTNRLEVMAKTQAQAITLEDGSLLALIAQPEGGEALQMAVLPGRVWAYAADPSVVELRLEGEAPLRLTRQMLRDWLEDLSGDPRLEGDDFLALQALEHLHFSKLLPELGAQAQRVFMKVAQHFGLRDYLQEGTPLVAAPAVAPALARLPFQLRKETLLSDLALGWRAAPDFDPRPLVQTALAQTPDKADLRDLFLVLTQVFCQNGAFEQLFDLAQGLDLPLAVGETGRWQASVRVAWWSRGEKLQELPKLIWGLSATHKGWLATSALAEGVVHGLCRQDVGQSLRNEILYAWRGLCQHEVASYWGRHGCAYMVDLARWLVQEAPLLPREMARLVFDTALEVYGLTPSFWDGLPPTNDPQLETARDAFARLQRALLGLQDGAMVEGREVEEALEVLEALRLPEVGRYRRLLLGPSGLLLDEGQSPDMAALLRANLPLGEALLRHATFPDESLAPIADPALREMLGGAVAKAWQGIPQVPQETLQRAVGKDLQQALGRLERGEGLSGAQLSALIAQFFALSGAENGWLGLGLALRLVEGLCRADLGEERAELLSKLSAFIAAQLARSDALTAPLAAAVVAARTRLLHLLERDAQMKAELASLAALFAKMPAAVALPAHFTAQDLPQSLHDLIVVVFSCRPNLDSRIPVMRAGWLADLAALGIPYVVVVGGASGEEINRQEGDVVYLDCPDDYEGLPQKTLASLQWVRDHTPYQRMMKIDDDCFLDVQTLFGSLQPLKFDYYGRSLRRSRGEMDRSWHNAKSVSARGRLELDKSPEPSVYADGGSGYVLSRRAICAALDQAQTPAGQRLIAVSFMEDKLLGDLLTRAGISVQSEGYRFAQERRTRFGGMTVPLWSNGPRPFQGGGIAGVHLDGYLPQPQAQAQAQSDHPQRSKIWPSWQAPTFGWSSNTVDLLSDPQRLERARQAEVAVVACLRNEMFMLPHFLDHYRRLGVEGFLIADNGSDDGTLEYLAEQPDVALFSVDTPYNASHYGVAWQEALLSSFRMGKWTVVADADELLVWPGLEPEIGQGPLGDLPGLLRHPDFAKADGVRLFMLDMYPEGPLSEAVFEGAAPFAVAGFADQTPFRTTSYSKGPFGDQPTWTSGLRHRLIPNSRPDLFVAQKIALLRLQPWMRLTEGLHYVGGVRLAPREMVFGHFKYTAQFRAKVEAEVARGQHFNDAEEYRKYLNLISEGREVIYDPQHSLPWRENAFLRELWQTGYAPK